MKTLEEKLIDKFMNVRWDTTLENAKEFVDIAEEFAIGFAEWYEEEILAKGDYNMIDKPKRELLEMYKKEKGLC